MPTEIAPAGHWNFGCPALFALAVAQIEFLPVMHQHMQHDIFGHPAGEIADRDANQRHFRQARVGHQRIDAGAEIENHPQIRKRRQFARAGLPDRGIVDVGRVERLVRARHQTAAVARTRRRTGASSAPATSFRSRHGSAARALLFSSDFCLIFSDFGRPYRVAVVSAKYFRFACRRRAYSVRPCRQTGTLSHALRHPLLPR